MDQLEILHRQMDSLKSSLAESRIVNRSMMVNIMKQKSSWLNNLVKTEFVLVPLSFIFFLLFCLFTGITVWVAVTYLVFAVADTYLDTKTVRVPACDFACDMVTLRRKLVRQKRLRFIQMAVSLPLAIAWGCWFAVECALHLTGMEKDMSYGTPLFWFVAVNIAFVIVGSVVITCILYFKMQSVNNEIIAQIDLLEDIGEEN